MRSEPAGVAATHQVSSVKNSETPTLVDSMGRDLFAGDVVLIPGIPVKWVVDGLELGSDGKHVRITAHANLSSIFPAEQPVPNITRVCTEEEKTELDEELQKAQLRKAPHIVRPH